MNHTKFKIFHLQLAHGFQNRRFCFFIAKLGYPNFCRQKDFFSRNAGLFKCPANGFLRERLSSVYVRYSGYVNLYLYFCL